MTEPDSAVLIARADVLIDARREEEAARLLREAIVGDPENAYAHIRLSAALLDLDPKEALAAAEAASRLDPSDEAPHRLRALSLMSLRRPRQAVRAAGNAVKLAPEEPLAHLVLALASERARKRSGARAAAETALQLDPELGEAHNLLGLLELDRNRGLLAQKHFEEALRHAPEEPAFLNNLGLALEVQGKKKEAIEWFLRAGRLDPRHEPAQKNVHRTTRAWIRGGIATTLFVLALRVVLVTRHFSLRWVLLSVGFVGLIIWAWVLGKRRQQRFNELSPEARSYWHEVEENRRASRRWWRRKG